MAFLDQINTAAAKTIVPGVVDNNFRNDPLLAYLKANSLRKYSGGPSWQENFLFGSLLGGAYKKGEQFDITQVPTKTGTTVTPRYYWVNVSLFREDIEVEARGEQAVLNLVDSALQEAALGMSARLAIALYNHGQNVGGVDRTAHINGLAEALNDGTNAGWTGDIFTNYFTLTRNDANIGSSLNSPMTGPAANVNGAISYSILERSYNSCVIGNEKPKIGVTTNLGMSFIKLQFQPQQRFESTDVSVGFTGLKFNDAMIMQSQYCPGTQGVDDARLGNYLASAGETFFWLNPRFLRLYVSTSPKYAFGFTGFVPAQDNTTVAGQYLYAGNFTCVAPRLMRHHFGITS